MDEILVETQLRLSKGSVGVAVEIDEAGRDDASRRGDGLGGPGVREVTDPNDFNEDFSAPSPELIEHLAGKGVLLIGIDTPSVDLFDSKDLPSHKMLPPRPRWAFRASSPPSPAWYRGRGARAPGCGSM